MGRHHHRRLLAYDAAAIPDGGSAVYAQLRLSVSYGKEPAGHRFHDAALKQAGLYEQEPGEESDAGDSSSMGPSRQGSTADFSSLPGPAGGGGGGDDDNAHWKGKGKRRKAKKQEGIDLYALLGLQNERHLATHDQIRKAYRAAALEHHPDKQHSAVSGDEAAVAASEERFKAIQEAYETLLDPAKRREFDSLDAFDDSLPGEGDAATPEAFYKAFGAAFRRNAKWSVNQPTPELGDDATPAAEVAAFYEFWFSFKSWREFPHPDEEDVEQAEGRDHRRWIERFNAKLREKGKKEEFRRVRDFVELSYQLDPRIRRQREEQKAERARRKASKVAEREAAEAAERRRAEEEAARKAEEEAAAAEARKARQVEKKALQRERAKLRKLCAAGAGNVSDVSEDEVELLCASLDLPTMNALCATLAALDVTPADKEAAVEEQLAARRSAEDQEAKRKANAAKAVAAAAQQAAKAEADERVARLRQWSEDEVRLLRKALDRFPLGTAKRWETVQAYVRTRTVEEIVDMVKHGLKSGMYEAPADGGPQIARKRLGNVVIHSEATARDEVFSDVQVQLQGEAAAALTSKPPAGKPQAALAVAAPAPVEPPAAAPPPLVAAPTVTAEWSEADELALVKALKDVPKDLADRWERVAAAVGTKTKAQCARRFKEMKESFKAKKSATG